MYFSYIVKYAFVVLFDPYTLFMYGSSFFISQDLLG